MKARKAKALLLLLFIPFLLSASPFEGKPSLFVIDAGHGGADPGAYSLGVMEKDIVLSISLLVKAKLDEGGAEAILTRQADVFLSLQERCDIANSQDFALSGYPVFVSIHANSAYAEEASGFEVYARPSERVVSFISTSSSNSQLLKYASYSKKELSEASWQKSVEIANVISNSVASAFPEGRMRGVKEDDLYVLNASWMPSVLIEIGFLSNSDERKAMVSPAWQEEMAKAIASALLSLN